MARAPTFVVALGLLLQFMLVAVIYGVYAAFADKAGPHGGGRWTYVRDCYNPVQISGLVEDAMRESCLMVVHSTLVFVGTLPDLLTYVFGMAALFLPPRWQSQAAAAAWSQLLLGIVVGGVVSFGSPEKIREQYIPVSYLLASSEVAIDLLVAYKILLAVALAKHGFGERAKVEKKASDRSQQSLDGDGNSNAWC